MEKFDLMAVAVLLVCVKSASTFPYRPRDLVSRVDRSLTFLSNRVVKHLNEHIHATESGHRYAGTPGHRTDTHVIRQISQKGSELQIVSKNSRHENMKRVAAVPREYNVLNIQNPVAQPQKLAEQSLGYRISKMVLIVASTIAALFTTCVMVAIFQCCCKGKRTQEDDDDDEANEKLRGQARIDAKNGDVTTPQSESDEGCDDGEDEQQISVKDKIKAFESQALKPFLPEDAPSKKRPKSRTSENFEDGLIGMGQVFRKKRAENRDSQTLSHTDYQSPVQVLPIAPPSTGANLAADDDNDFRFITRESSILKSFKRAPPPKNRSKAKRTSRQRTTIHDNEEKKLEMPAETDNEKATEANAAPNVSPKPTKRNSFKEAAKAKQEDVPDVVTKVDKPDQRSETKEPDVTSIDQDIGAAAAKLEEKSQISNIFFHIDPTAKVEHSPPKMRRSESDNVTLKRHEKETLEVNQSSVDRSSTSQIEKSTKFMMPSSCNDDDLQQLIKSLKKKLKEEAKDEDASSQSSTDSSTQEEPILRERTQSEPCSRTTAVALQTDL